MIKVYVCYAEIPHLRQQTVLSHPASRVLHPLPQSIACPAHRVFDAMAAFEISPGTNFDICLSHAGLDGSSLC